MDIAAIGEILVDMTQTHTDEDGTPHFAACPGGAPANVAVAAARLGASASFIGCVGNDPFGEMLRRTLLENGVRADGLQKTDKASTTLAVVTVDDSGERSFSFCRAPGADTMIDEAAALTAAEGCGILHFGSVSLTDARCAKTVINVVKAAKARGSLISFDPNYREALWPDIKTAEEAVRSAIPLCDIVKISAEEAVIATGRSDPSKAAEALENQGTSLILVTLGADGAFWRFRGKEGREPGIKVKVCDTNGAGDSFMGAVLAMITEKGGLSRLCAEDISEAVRFANLAASITVSRRGAIPALPRKQDLF
ncbi:MAG: carbohydrate kinase [Firmicutes bacterium]|nr:carbohydrate kinase [Bacillota bacterium]